jgi:hypothetical protein
MRQSRVIVGCVVCKVEICAVVRGQCRGLEYPAVLLEKLVGSAKSKSS